MVAIPPPVRTALQAFVFAAGLASVSVGAPPPAPEPGSAPAPEDTPDLWSLQPPAPAPLPPVRQPAWIQQPLDAFILHRLEAEGLAPAPEAEPRALIRRLSFDLTGLPPAAADAEAFARNPSPAAYERLVERLLSSPAFGERLASLWLNLARYAEDQAHQVGDDTKFFYPNAYRYRRWVIDAFNRDLPYDAFIRLQLAADFLGDTGHENLAALGFLGLGPQYYNRNRLDVMADEWEDRVDTVSRSFLGLTVACARCHDHKYDPVSAEDYHALAGVFASTRMLNRVDPPAPEGAELTDDQKKARFLHVVEEGEIQNLPVFLRGDVDRKGPEVPRRFLRALSPGEPEPFRNGSGRLELAEAIADPGNPLTARVFVNRLWGLIFGAPLVTTPSNFGTQGAPPTHPELLDYLARRFASEGWSVKDLARTMVLSAAYRQSAEPSPAARERDPSNRWLSHMPRRRLTVEMWRDALLAASGELERAGGPSMELQDPSNRRRTVYGRVSRLELDPTLSLFDYPDPNVHCEQRSVTTTPLQKLFVLNDPFVIERCRIAAESLLRATPDDTAAALDQAYQQFLSRPPEEWEAEAGLAYLTREGSPDRERWTSYLQAIAASNAFLYRD